MGLKKKGGSHNLKLGQKKSGILRFAILFGNLLLLDSFFLDMQISPFSSIFMEDLLFFLGRGWAGVLFQKYSHMYLKQKVFFYFRYNSSLVLCIASSTSLLQLPACVLNSPKLSWNIL